MHTIHSIYLGDLRTSLKHLSSNAELFTDAPLDNQGKGESFSPTDLLCASLAACALTIAGIASRTHEFNIDGVEVEITKSMISNPRRISAIGLRFFNFPEQLSDKQKAIFENSVKTCPVMLSLSAEIQKNTEYDY